MLPMEVSQVKDPFRRPTVEVVAPCNMQAGFTFMANHDGLTFPVQVPTGGVKEGQIFRVPYSSGDLNGSSSFNAAAGGAATEGTFLLFSGHVVAQDHLGQWKSSLFDCMRYGLCHPSLTHAICCPQLLMAQVLTRLKLNWLGEPTTEPKRTFPIVLAIVIVYVTLSIWLAPQHDGGGRGWNSEQNRTTTSTTTTNMQSSSSSSWLQVAVYQVIYTAFALYTWLVLTKLRTAVRRRHGISTQVLHGIWEDVCVSFWCGCCSVAQLARQTAEYETQPAACCSRTGLGTNSEAFPASVLTV